MIRSYRAHILGFLLAGMLGFAGSLLAQQAVPGSTPVQSFQPLYACDTMTTATGAANTAVTATIPAVSGKYFYVCSIDIVLAANAAVTGAAGPAPVFTTTNLPTNLVWWGTNETLGTGAARPVITVPFGVVPLKTAVTGTAFTIVTSGGQSTQNVRINVTGFYGG